MLSSSQRAIFFKSVNPGRFKEIRRWLVLGILEEPICFHANFHRPMHFDTELCLLGDDASLAEVDAIDERTEKIKAKKEIKNQNPGSIKCKISQSSNSSTYPLA